MRKNFWILLALIIIAAGAVIIFFVFHKKTAQACFSSRCFSVELAKTPDAWEKGLMFRKTLGQNQGMLFIFPAEGIYPFWMKNTLIPLDIIWLGQDKKIVFISQNSQPCRVENCPTINPGVKAEYVLEINAGLAEKLGLSPGSQMEIK